MLSKIKNNKEILGIVLLALLIRLIGIKHGFPFIFHIDEPALVRSATGIRFNPNVGYFAWPHMHYYLNFFVFWGFIKFRGLLNLLSANLVFEPVFPLLWRDPLVFYFLARVFDAFFGALTVLPVYLIGKRLISKKGGIIAALIMALIPHHIHVSHFALVDVPMVFWLAWALYFATRLIDSDNPRLFILAGLFIGFSASTKYNGGLLAFVVPLAYFLNSKEKFLSLKTLKLLTFSGLAALFGFIVGTPYSVLDFDTFMISDSPIGAMWQFTNVGKVGLAQYFPQVIRVFTIEYLYDTAGLYLLLLVATLFAIKNKSKKMIIILIPVFLFILYTSSFDLFRSHYFLIAYPFLTLSAAYLFEELNIRYFGTYLVVLAVCATLAVVPLAKKDTRVLAYEWLQQNLVETDMIRYNDDSFSLVTEKFDNKSSKDEKIGKAGEAGYYISVDERQVGREVYEIDDTFRRGGKIYIYALK